MEYIGSFRRMGRSVLLLELDFGRLALAIFSTSFAELVRAGAVLKSPFRLVIILALSGCIYNWLDRLQPLAIPLDPFELPLANIHQLKQLRFLI
jgi:hypothetical protein